MKNFTKLAILSLAILPTLAFPKTNLIVSHASDELSSDSTISVALPVDEEVSNDVADNLNEKDDLTDEKEEKSGIFGKILVYGHGKVTAKPNVAYLTVGAENTSENLDDAVKQNNELLSSIFDYLSSKGIEKDNVKTQCHTIFQRYDYNNGESFIGHQVSDLIEVKISDIDNISTYINDISALGAIKITNLTFDNNDKAALYQEALKLALDDANQKASSLASSNLSVKAIFEEQSFNCMPYRIASANFDNIAPGDIDVVANIKVVYTIA